MYSGVVGEWIDGWGFPVGERGGVLRPVRVVAKWPSRGFSGATRFAGNGVADRSSPWRRRAGGGCSGERCGGGRRRPDRRRGRRRRRRGCAERRRLDASGGGEQGVGGQGGSQQAESGEGVTGTLDEQEHVEIVGIGGQPEAAAGFGRAGGHALERVAVGSGAGADEFGADGVLMAVAADEDGVAAGVGI